ncbi:9537_t:CDS:2 [Ambispora leptoticha]|uniref:9537_t:CDS:1 n=1 Tax=Ambispora leptoticha TaxID=144679 RepID=A0A9N9FW71_9GLOM|nr:9537_t:CDS:2 [Ambispora leptoticha]
MNPARGTKVRPTFPSPHQGKQEIPQIKNGIIAIRDVLRLPGLMSKVVVEKGKVAIEKGLDIEPAGTCIGERGERASNYLGINIHVRILEEVEKDEVLQNKGQVLQEIAKGQSVARNQTLSWDLLTDYCQSIRIAIKKKSGINFSEIIQEYVKKNPPKEQLVARPPLVSIMGHIDHGKTTLLDTIRQSQVQKKEAGGITQKVSVSQAEFQGQKITFLDTPGHSDFIKMRQRGISLTDLVVLVIDARDGIMPQTAEIIDYLRQYQLPLLVFINHKKPSETDNETNLNRIRTQLQEKGLTPLEWGGEIIAVSGNAKEKESVHHLMENILLFADFKASLHRPAHGVIIDSYLHPQTGSQINELLVQDGKLKEKDIIFLNGKFGKAKMIFGLHGQKITTVYPSDIVQVIGLNISAELGDRFLVVDNEEAIAEIENELANYWEKKKKSTLPPPSSEKKNVNLVLTADSQNSLEALTELIRKKTAPNFNFSIIYTTVGNLNSFALDLAKITNSTVLIFGYQPSQKQIKIWKEDKIPFFGSKIIYEISDKLDEIISSQQEVEEVEEIVGTATVKKVFYFSKGNIAGCQVVSGKINRNKRIYVLQGKEEKKVFTGEIKSLESNKVEKNEISAGQECGIVLKGFDNFQEGDKIVAFQLIKRNVIQEK